MVKVFSVIKYIEESLKRMNDIYETTSNLCWAINCDGKTAEEMQLMGCMSHEDWMVDQAHWQRFLIGICPMCGRELNGQD